MKAGPHEDTLRFHYIKSNYFRTVHCDGAIGAISPRLQAIEVAFYSERLPIPQVVAHKIDVKNGQLKEEILTERVMRDGVVREVEVNVVLDIDGAERLVEWLNGKIREAKNAQGTRENLDSKKEPRKKVSKEKAIQKQIKKQKK